MDCLIRTLPSTADKMRVVCFKLGAKNYAVDVEEIEAICWAFPIIPTPDLPAFMEGEMYFRHSRMPVVNLRRQLGMPTQPLNEETRVLIYKTKKGPVGLLVDRLSEIQKLPPSVVKPPPDESPDYIRAVVSAGKGSLLLPDFEKLTDWPDDALAA